MTMTDDADVPPPAGYTVRPNGRPTGRSNKWANVSVRPRSSRSKSPPPLFDTGPAAPYRADSVGQASRSLNASNSLPARRATLSPVPPGCALPTLVRPQPKRQCRGIYDGCFGAALQFAGRAMMNTGRLLLEWSREHDAGVKSFARSALARSTQMLLPHRGMDVRRAGSGFSIFHTECRGECDGRSKKRRCNACNDANNMRRDVRAVYQPAVPAVARTSRIDYIARDPAVARAEIIAGREREREVRCQLRQKAAAKVLDEEGYTVSGDRLQRTQEAIQIMDGTIARAGLSDDQLELWEIQRDRLNAIHFNGGTGRNKKKVKVHPVLMSWAIAFLARTSISVYKEVQRVMKLPHIRHVQRETEKMVSRNANKAFALCTVSMKAIGEMATKDGWNDNARNGVISFDSCSLNAGVDHDHVTNTIVGGDESRRISSLSQMFEVLANKVNSAAGDSEADPEDVKSNSILDELKLAQEHLVFKWTSTDPETKCSEIVASINVEVVTAQLVASVLDRLRDTLPIYGIHVSFATADAAGSTWKAFASMAEHPVSKIIPGVLRDEYVSIDFSINIVHQCPVSGCHVILLPDMPHLIKCICTALELSSRRDSKRDLKYGKCFMNLQMVCNVWRALGGGTSQLQESKLTAAHFDKNAFSRMNVALAMQVFSSTVTEMIRRAIDADDVALPTSNKGAYKSLSYLCENVNNLADICNGRHERHTPANAVERQHNLLRILDWFSKWKSIHDERVAAKEATEYNFFAEETWGCIQALVLAHVAIIQLHCVEKKVAINPRVINTDVVEWFFGDARSMVGGATNKLRAKAANAADRKASAFNRGRHGVVGNNKSGAVDVFKREQNRFNA